MRVGLTFHLDDNVSECAKEISQIAASIQRLGHDVIKIGSAGELVDKLAAGERFDLVFNAGRNNENSPCDAQIPTLLSIYDLASCFSSPATMNLCAQRNHLKSLLRDRGVPTSDYWLVETLGDLPRIDTAYPAVVGPTARCCSSSWVTVKDAVELSKACCQVMGSFGTPALIEQAMPGQTVVVGVLGDGGAARVLMAVDAPHALASSIERTAKAAWRIVSGWDAGCISLVCDSDGQPHIVNIEPLPSLTASSPLMKLAAAAGLNLENVVEQILQSASSRIGRVPRAQPPRPHLSDASVGSAPL